MSRGRCPDCDSGGLFGGDGKCAQCHGTGINTQLDSAQPNCPYCDGSGVCAACGGLGYPDRAEDEIQTLFGGEL